MFIRQAAEQFTLFTKLPAPQEYMAETLRRASAAARAVVNTDGSTSQGRPSED
jgi:hypothetical protein